ncbi:related to threonine aldolase [Phialocephala subalpina]|uniref:Related to threonine aldolase n=1 Tax=Phialocephala subalpina TaxID=576137 RepID=A0A1L7WL57_9HELO|nr:related to threonine aldolase [Phialocephala subalpina]
MSTINRWVGPQTGRRMQSAVAVKTAVQTQHSAKVGNEANAAHFLESLTVGTQWSHPGDAQFDFRSDVVTRPTLPMLQAIVQTTLQDDVYREDQTTSSFEQRMADLTGHEAGAFVLSGTMANILALRTHLTQPPHAVLCDARSHVVHWEAGGMASICGAMVQRVKPSNREFLTLEDVQKHAVLSDDVHLCPTTVVSLENTISGLVHPLPELSRISEWACERGLKVHIDGARLWEAVATGKGSLKGFAACCDSLSLDFSKGLGAPMGAMVLGSAEFIARAKRIRKSMGGGMRQAGVLSAAANAAVDETFGPGFWGRNAGGKLREAHSMARKVADMWVKRGGRLIRRTETNIVWIDLKGSGISKVDFNEIGEKYGIKLDGKRLVLHYQISKEALLRLTFVFDEVALMRDGLL